MEILISGIPQSCASMFVVHNLKPAIHSLCFCLKFNQFDNWKTEKKTCYRDWILHQVLVYGAPRVENMDFQRPLSSFSCNRDICLASCMDLHLASYTRKIYGRKKSRETHRAFAHIRPHHLFFPEQSAVCQRTFSVLICSIVRDTGLFSIFFGDAFGRKIAAKVADILHMQFAAFYRIFLP